MDLALTDKIAIVTGSSRGLGFASAAALVREGCRVAICARGGPRLTEAAAELQKIAPGHPGKPGHDLNAVLPLVADLATPEGIESVVTRTVDVFGGVDILVNNVGLGAAAASRIRATPNGRKRSSRPCFPAIRASRLTVPHMRRRGGGAIVMIASIWGRESGGRMTYNAVKAAEISLAKSMARELAPDNIRVNSVAPGSISFREERGTAVSRKIRREWPISSDRSCRLGASAAPKRSGGRCVPRVPQASWISGARLPVDGCQSRSQI